MGTLTAIWPVVIVVGLVATVSWRTMALMLLAYTAVFVGAIALMQQGGQPDWTAIARSWWAGPGTATLVVLVFLARPIRAMGLLILVLTMAAWGGVFAINEVLDKTNAIELIVGVLPEITSKSSTYLATGVLALVFWGIPAIIAAVACYLALRGLGRLYRARWFSDQQLQIDAVWLIFTLAYGWSLLPIGGLLAFFAYKLVATAGLRLIARTTPPDESATRLLLLRVFSLGVRSSRLFEGFARQWRYRGSMRMIAGPDLANATVEPHEFLDFLAGRLDRRFIDGPRMLEQRLAEALPQRDPDGRFRVTSFFCHDDTWRMVLRRLARQSDAVMMDLRGFSAQHQGCLFEIEVLLDTMPLDRIVLVVDDTTDEPYLRTALHKSWEKIAADSPNHTDPAPRIRLFNLDRTGERDVARLVATVAAAEWTRSRFHRARVMQAVVAADQHPRATALSYSNRLNLIRCGSTAASPSRFFLSSS